MQRNSQKSMSDDVLPYKITVVTAITGGRDTLIRQPAQTGIQYVCFSDEDQHSKGWEVRKACDKFDPYLNAKIHKVLIHKYVDSDYTVWIDGSVEIRHSIEKMVNVFLKDYDVAVYNHSSWLNDRVRTIEDEIALCCANKVDKPERIHEQIKNNAYPKKVLPVCGIIFRRNNNQTNRLNEQWWSEICRYSVRDQLSFPYVFKEYYEIPSKILDDFVYHPHNKTL